MRETLRLSWLVMTRHWRVYRKYFWSNILPTFVEPVFFILSLGVGLGAYVSDMDGLTYAQYMGPGLATGAALFTAFFDSSYGFYVRLTIDGIYKAIFTTPIGPKEVIFGELIWVSLKGAVMSTAVACVFMLFGLLEPTFGLLGLLVTGAVVGFSCGGLGLMSSALIKNISQFQTVYTVLISPLFFFSGIFFPISKMPQWLQYFAHISPVYHGVILNQQLLWGRFDGPSFAMHFFELVILSILTVFLAYRLVLKKLYV